MIKRLFCVLTNLLHDEEGVTAIEYGLLAALIALAIVVGATAIGGGLNSMFNDIASRLSSV